MAGENERGPSSSGKSLAEKFLGVDLSGTPADLRERLEQFAQEHQDGSYNRDNVWETKPLSKKDLEDFFQQVLNAKLTPSHPEFVLQPRPQESHVAQTGEYRCRVPLQCPACFKLHPAWEVDYPDGEVSPKRHRCQDCGYIFLLDQDVKTLAAKRRRRIYARYDYRDAVEELYDLLHSQGYRATKITVPRHGRRIVIELLDPHEQAGNMRQYHYQAKDRGKRRVDAAHALGENPDRRGR